MIEQDFYTLLAGTAAITALVAGRIHHAVRPEGETGAAIVFQRVSTVPVASLDGESGLDAVRLQVKVISASHLQAFDIVSLVRDAVRASTTVKGKPVMLIADVEEKTGDRIAIIDFNFWERR